MCLVMVVTLLTYHMNCQLSSHADTLIRMHKTPTKRERVQVLGEAHQVQEERASD